MSTRGLALSFALFMALSPASGAEKPADLDAQKLIDACWAISQQDRDSGVTSRMRHGAATSIGCLEDTIVEQAKAFKFDPAEVQRHLDNIQDGIQKLYWRIYNDNPACFCGTFYHVLHLPPNAEVLEEIVRTMVRQRQQYGF